MEKSTKRQDIVTIFKSIYRVINPRTPHQRRSILKEFYGNIIFKSFTFVDSPFWIIWNPDASYEKAGHPEMVTLSKAWVRGNLLNNAGDITRLYSFILNIKQMLAENIEGDFAELGVWRGNSAAVLAHFASKHRKKCFLFDTFSGFDERDFSGVDADQTKSFSNTSLEFVKTTVGDNSSAVFVPGYFPDSITRDLQLSSTFSFVSIDCDLYEPMKAALAFFYPRMSKGGVLFLHDYSSGLWNGATKAIDEFVRLESEFPILLPDKSGTAVIRKTK